MVEGILDRKLGGLILAVLMTTNAWALGVSQIQVTPTGITFTYRDGVEVINFAGMGVADVTEANAQVIEDYIQGLLDVRIKRSTLPHDDSNWGSDPNRAGAFWDGTDVVYRNTLVNVFIENNLFNVMLCTVDVNDITPPPCVP